MIIEEDESFESIQSFFFKVKNQFHHIDSNFLIPNKDIHPSQRWNFDLFSSAYQLAQNRSFLISLDDSDCHLRVFLPHLDLFNHHSRKGVCLQTKQREKVVIVVHLKSKKKQQVSIIVSDQTIKLVADSPMKANQEVCFSTKD